MVRDNATAEREGWTHALMYLGHITCPAPIYAAKVMLWQDESMEEERDTRY